LESLARRLIIQNLALEPHQHALQPRLARLFHHLEVILQRRHTRPFWAIPYVALQRNMPLKPLRGHQTRPKLIYVPMRSPAPVGLKVAPGARLAGIAAVGVGCHKLVPALELLSGRRPHACLPRCSQRPTGFVTGQSVSQAWYPTRLSG